MAYAAVRTVHTARQLQQRMHVQISQFSLAAVSAPVARAE